MIEKRFTYDSNGVMKCRGQEMPPKDAVELLNNADDIIFKLYTVLDYCIDNGIVLNSFGDADTLFAYLEDKGVI